MIGLRKRAFILTMFVLLVSIVIMSFMLSFTNQKSYFRELVSRQILFSSLNHINIDLSDDVAAIFGDNLQMDRLSQHRVSFRFKLTRIPEIQKPFSRLLGFMKNYTNITGVNTSMEALGIWNTTPAGWGTVVLNISNASKNLYSYVHFSASSTSKSDYAALIKWADQKPSRYAVNISCSAVPFGYHVPSLTATPPTPPTPYLLINISYPGGSYFDEGYLPSGVSNVTVLFGYTKTFGPWWYPITVTYITSKAVVVFNNTISSTTVQAPLLYVVRDDLRPGGTGGKKGAWLNVSINSWLNVSNSTVYATYPVLINATISQNLTVVGRPTLFAS